MAGDGYNYRGYSSNGRPGPLADDSIKMRYVTSDHVYKPVLIDAAERRKIISYVPNMNADVYYFVTKTESSSTAYDPTPLLSEYHYRYASPERVRRPSSPVHYRMEEEHFRPASPVHYRVDKEKHLKPVSPVRDHPKEVKEFLANVQNEATKPNRNKSPHTNPSYFHLTPNSYQVDTAGDLPCKDWNKPNGNKLKHDAFNDYYREPVISETKPRPRPNPTMWETPPDASLTLSKPTNDIHAAMELIRQAAKVSGPDSRNSSYTVQDTDAAMELIRQAAKVSGPDSKSARYAVPVSIASGTNGKNEITASREAQKRSGNLKSLSQEKEAYSGTIDSKMAAKKYGGTLV